jgi:hypothetical protein
MTTISIDVSKSELDFIREAVLNKYTNLMSYLDSHANQIAVKPTISEVAAWADKAFETEYVKKPHWTHTAKGKKILAARKRTKK